MDWMKFKGARSDDMHVRLTKFPKLIRAEERVTEVMIPGRPEPLTVLEGDRPVYKSITLTPELTLLAAADKNAVKAWVSGAGDLIFSDDPDYCYHARAVAEMELEQIIRGKKLRSIAPKFKCSPFLYLSNPETYTNSTSFSITNPGTVEADSIWEITGNGDINFLVGDKVMLLDSINGSIVIDCDQRIAYKDNVLMTGLISGDWPTLLTGATTVSWTGSVTQVKLWPRWRWK